MIEKVKVNLILFRHGPAGDRVKFKKTHGLPDHKRPLTRQGVVVTKNIAQLLRKSLNPVHSIYSSPYTRTWQTAEILLKRNPSAELNRLDLLKPSSNRVSSFRKILDHILNRALSKERNREENIVLVGHEPSLSFLLSFILTGSGIVISDIKKAGFAWLQLEISANKKYKAHLKCLVSPKFLKT